MSNIWDDIQDATDVIYVVQTSVRAIARCLLMTTDPGDLIFDPTCGSGTTAYVAEQWGRRWITCDTSRVAITLAKQRLMTDKFDYYELAHPDEGIRSGFKYKTVPHITLKSIANNEPPQQETLYDRPYIEKGKVRVTAPFTVEAVPSLRVKPFDGSVPKVDTTNEQLARTGETGKQAEWRDELKATGIRAVGNKVISFSRIEPMIATKFLHAEGEILEEDGTNKKAYISFGPDYGSLEQRQVELAINEARSLKSKPDFVIFAAFHFDPEAAKDIDLINWQGVKVLKAQMSVDLLTKDLRKKRSSNQSYWLIGQPDIAVISDKWLVDRGGRRIILYELCKKLSGLNSLAEINGLGREDILAYAAISERPDLWDSIANATVSNIGAGKHSRGAGKEQQERIYAVSGDSKGFIGRVGDFRDLIRKIGLLEQADIRRVVNELRRNKQIIERASQITCYSPLTTTILLR